MGTNVKANSWVEIHRILLNPEERAPGIPQDTKKVPLELRVKGFLTHPAQLGDKVKIKTPIGRVLEGKLLMENPPFPHDFGAPVPELLAIGQEIKTLLHQGGISHEG